MSETTTFAGREAARAFAQWHLGDAGWADAILDAAENPERTWRDLGDDGMRLPVGHGMGTSPTE